MRTKLFLAAMAAVAVVGCNKEMEGNGPVANTNGTVSLINVSLKAAGTMTKAGETFEYGTEDENKIESATFYFFDAEGAPYIVAETNAVELNAKDLTANAEETPGSIEAYTDVVLVLKSHKAAPPAQMVALINAGDYAGKTLAELEAAATEIQSEAGFVMSNSVYDGDQGVVTATQILPENIFVDPELEGTPGDLYEGEVDVEPVDIYVERVAAKVRVNAEAEDGLIPVEGAEGTYAKILGWEVTNTTATSHLIKNYAETDLFSPFNNAAFFRSYWANTIEGAKAIHGLTFTDIKNALGTSAYYHENTLLQTAAPEGWVNDVDKEGTTDDANNAGIQAPQLIVAAQLVDAEGKAKEFAKWYGTDYENGDALKATMIANATKQIFVKGAEANTYVSIDIDDVTFYQIDDQTSYYEEGWNGDYRYEVRVKATEGTEYFDAAGEAMDAAAVNTILNKIEPAMIWAGGKTYYFTLINHFGDAKGMVRNHLYDINITSVKGLGTPVYNEEFIITPEVPVEQDGYHLTATINVLSWNVVSQDVELGF